MKRKIFSAALCVASTLAVPAVFATDADETVVVDSVASQEDGAGTNVEAPEYGPALLAFLYAEPGICPDCDAARSVVDRAASYYPVVAIAPESPIGRLAIRNWNVEDFPTFVLVDRTPRGARELWRRTGATTLAQIDRAFAKFGLERSAKPLPPPRRPRPVPRPEPQPEPRPTPPRPSNGGPKPTPRPRWFEFWRAF